MKADELERNLKEGKLESIYLLYGEETYLLEMSLKKIKNLFGEKVTGINYITIDDENLSELINDLDMPAFGFDKKLIIVKARDLFKKEIKRKNTKVQIEAKKLYDYLNDNKNEVKQSNVLVFIADNVEKNDLYQIIEKTGIVCNFENLKLVDLVKKLKSICNCYKVRVDDSTLNYLIQNCGTGMQELINELRKLIEYAGERRRI